MDRDSATCAWYITFSVISDSFPCIYMYIAYCFVYSTSMMIQRADRISCTIALAHALDHSIHGDHAMTLVIACSFREPKFWGLVCSGLGVGDWGDGATDLL